MLCLSGFELYSRWVPLVSFLKGLNWVQHWVSRIGLFRIDPVGFRGWQQAPSWGGGALLYLAYTSLCGFQGLESLTGYTISLLSALSRVSFWNGSLSKGVKTCDERSTFAIPIILYTKQNKSGSESNVSCLKQGSEMSNFCLKQGQGLKALAAPPYPN